MNDFCKRVFFILDRYRAEMDNGINYFENIHKCLNPTLFVAVDQNRQNIWQKNLILEKIFQFKEKQN